MASTVASLFTALLPHQGQRHTDWSDGTSSPEYKIKNGLLWWQTAWTVPPSGCGSHDTKARTAQCIVALREWEHTAEQKSVHKERFTLRSRCFFVFLFFSSTTKKKEREKNPYWVHTVRHGSRSMFGYANKAGVWLPCHNVIPPPSAGGVPSACLVWSKASPWKPWQRWHMG